MAKKGKKKLGVSLELHGFQEYLNKVEKAQGDLVDAVTRSVVASSKPIEADLLGFIEPRTRSGNYVHTIDSYRNVYEVDRNLGIITYQLGFDMKNGGIASLMFDVGTPTMKPTFFIHNAFENNVDKVKAEQERVMKQVLRELM